MIINSSEYQLRKLIVELKHPGDLLHSQKVGSALQELVPQFDMVSQKGGAIPDVIELVNNVKSFRKLICAWDRIVYSEEKLPDVATGITNAKHYIGHIVSRLGIETFDRLGVRSHYIIPVNVDYSELLKWYNGFFVKSIDIFSPFGKITDVGLYAFTGTDDNYDFNLSIAPLTKDEYRKKLSEYKQEYDTFENALFIDIDLYYAKRSSFKPVQLIETLADQSRIKVNQFLEKINQKK